MKIVALSIERDYKDYSSFLKIASEIEKDDEFSEFVSLVVPMASQLKNEKHSPIQFIMINWNDIGGATNIKLSKYGKEYNADAPKEAVSKIVKYATHFVKIGKGDYLINTMAREAGLKEIVVNQQSPKSPKYKV